eukprot:3700563-Alexandrium_andersonii.AAC.1
MRAAWGIVRKLGADTSSALRTPIVPSAPYDPNAPSIPSVHRCTRSNRPNALSVSSALIAQCATFL